MTFNEILNQVKKPNKIQLDTKLPYIFDLNYNLKNGYELCLFVGLNNSDVNRLLAENGFDVSPQALIELYKEYEYAMQRL